MFESFDWSISLGNILTVATMTGGGYVYLSRRNKENREEVEKRHRENQIHFEERHKETNLALLNISKTLIALSEKSIHLDKDIETLREALKASQADRTEIWKHLAKLHDRTYRDDG